MTEQRIEAENGEFPDAKPTREQRETLKEVARIVALDHDEHELMFLAGALEAEAQKKRAER